jgi:dephospho-CoA kinase
MTVLGVVGGIASGKSLVSRELARLGAEVIEADQLGHEVLREPAVEAAARARWGSEVFGPDGYLHRPAIAERVFQPGESGTRECEFLEQLMHPRITARMRGRIEQCGGALKYESLTPNQSLSPTLSVGKGNELMVLDAALLLEAGWQEFCDAIVFIEAPRDVRFARAQARGWTEEEFSARESAQMSLDEKRRRANLVIDNSGNSMPTDIIAELSWRGLPVLIVTNSKPAMCALAGFVPWALSGARTLVRCSPRWR